MMNDWETELALGHGLVTLEVPPPPQADALEHDALFEALVFLDDLELDTSDMTAVKNEFGAAHRSAVGVIPAEAYVPQAAVEQAAKPKQPLSPPVSVTSSASPPASPSTASEAASTHSKEGKVKGVVNRSRNRRREELSYLRNMVGELEERLTTLRKRAEEQQQHEQGKLTGEIVTADDPVLTAVWEDLATRQYAQRQRAEAENNKLRRMLEDQIQVGKSLERLLKKRNNADELDVRLNAKRPRCASLTTKWNTSTAFEDLIAELPSLYNQLTAEFSKVSFERSNPNFRDIQVRTDPEHGMMMEITEAHIFPFDFDLTVDHYWKMFVEPDENETFHFHDVEIGEDTIKVQFGISVQIPRANGNFSMKIVSRRYVEADRVVIVWVALLDPTEISETNMDGIYMRHKGWTVIEPLAPDLPSPSSAEERERRNSTAGARIRSYAYAIPEAFEDVPDQKRKVGTLTNFMLSMADVKISARQLQLENRLVEVSRSRS